MLSYEELYEKYATDVLRVSYFYLGDRQRAGGRVSGRIRAPDDQRAGPAGGP